MISSQIQCRSILNEEAGWVDKGGGCGGRPVHANRQNSSGSGATKTYLK